MGMEQAVRFGSSGVPDYETLRDFLAGVGFPLQTRMIDSELAFPDEMPPQGWREIRVGTPAGMITFRREGNTVRFVTWGNSAPDLVRAWNALVWASAHVGNGTVITESGELSAEEYRRSADLPEGFR
jgi:hypothetical protein